MLLGLQPCDCASRLLFCFLACLSFSRADDFFDGTKLKNLEFPMQWQLRLGISKLLKIVSVCTFMDAHELFLHMPHKPRCGLRASCFSYGTRKCLTGPKDILGNNLFELLLLGLKGQAACELCLAAARSSNSRTSSSCVGEKSWYHWPTAKNGTGVIAHTTWSTSLRNSSQVDSEATGTAAIICVGF